jgi:hypothetical protein
LPVGTAADAPQKAKAPSWILSALASFSWATCTFCLVSEHPAISSDAKRQMVIVFSFLILLLFLLLYISCEPKAGFLG